MLMCSVKHVKRVQNKTFSISSSSTSGESTSALLYLDQNIHHKSSMSTLGNRFTISTLVSTPPSSTKRISYSNVSPRRELLHTLDLNLHCTFGLL